jgi:hypothetical protein
MPAQIEFGPAVKRRRRGRGKRFARKLSKNAKKLGQKLWPILQYIFAQNFAKG